MRKRPFAVCFVDDDPTEISRFKANLGSRFVLGCGTSISNALEDLEKQGRAKPNLFLLDMYHAESAPSVDEAGTKLHQARVKFLKAEAEFYKTLASLRQTSEGGFRNLRDIRSRFRFPRIAVAFFTRKGTIDNAIKAYEDEIQCPVIKKPDPNPTEAADVTENSLPNLYDVAFTRDSARVIADIERVIQRSTFTARNRDLLIGAGIGAVVGYITSILSSLTLSWLCK
jgi:hypothetical protein